VVDQAVSPKILACLAAPGGGGALERIAGAFRAQDDGTHYPDVDGVPALFARPNGADGGVTARVKDFYEENPFPNYDGVEDFGKLVHKGFRNPFSAGLLDAIGCNKLVLEVGCGTGQLAHFLQLNNNHTLGVDMSLASLRLAVEHKRRNNLVRSGFVQMNIFDLAIADGAFDVVIAHGVLHHTFDARRAFAAVARKAKPGGIVMVGLYNWYARVPTWIRSKLIGTFGPEIDFVVRRRIRDAEKARIWIADQYRNPHETWHSIDDVLGWFDECGLEFVNCVPAILGTAGEEADSYFAATAPGTRGQRVVSQLSWLFTIAREGALFDVVGRRRAS